jgi:hypothetical protein
MALELFYGQVGKEEEEEQEEQEEEYEHPSAMPAKNIRPTSGITREVPLTTRKPT